MKWVYYLLAALCWTGAGYFILIAYRMRPEKTFAAMAETTVEPYEVWCFGLAIVLAIAGRAAQAAAHDAAAARRHADGQEAIYVAPPPSSPNRA